MHISIIQLSTCDVTWRNVFGDVGGTGAGGWVHPNGVNSMAASGLSCGKLLVGTGWAISLLLCMNGLRKWSSGRVEPPFLAVMVKLLSHSVRRRLSKSRDYWKLVRKWVWF